MRNAFDDRRDQQIADDFTSGSMPCRSCQARTDIRTLSSLGALCEACFAHYCDESTPRSRLTIAKRRDVVEKLAELGQRGK